MPTIFLSRFDHRRFLLYQDNLIYQIGIFLLVAENSQVRHFIKLSGCHVDHRIQGRILLFRTDNLMSVASHQEDGVIIYRI